ncbi:MAG: dihydrolipoamide acetyltransferase family protein [Halioglobus sp.]|jgi:pyruvate dehydrogenase E2 component (dihydrolipoamide acetyltransferase)
MIKDFLMPKLAMAMNEGTINAWLVEEGAWVEKGAMLVEVETEKVAYEVESPLEGFVHIAVPAGETVPVESPIAQFASDEAAYQSMSGDETAAGSAGASAAVVTEPHAGEPRAESTRESTAAPGGRIPGGRIKASPLARKMAADRGMDLAALSGTGPGGRIVKRDILAAESWGATAAPAPVAPIDAARAPLEPVRIPFRAARAAIAKRMVESLQSSAQLSSFWEVELDQLLALRQQFLAREEQLGTRVSINAFLVKAIAYAAARVPIANAQIDGDEIVIHRAVNVGIATALPGASEYESVLLVPVLKNVQAMGVVEIDVAMRSLVERARRNELGADDMSGSTITLSTTAGLSPPGTRSTPVLNLPNTTLIGPSTPEQKPVVRDGEMAIRTMMPISMTFDHRVMDGEPAARFARALHEAIEQPGLMLG